MSENQSVITSDPEPWKNLQPLYDYVVLEQVRETNKGGIEIPLSSQQSVLSKATVRAVGQGRYDTHNGSWVPVTLKAGDTVYINSLLGMKVKINSKTEYIVQTEGEIRVKFVAS